MGRTALGKTQRIGELLAAQPHGAFGPWIAANLPFSERIARNYLRLHRERAQLKAASITDLAGVYRLLTEHTGGGAKPERPDPAGFPLPLPERGMMLEALADEFLYLIQRTGHEGEYYFVTRLWMDREDTGVYAEGCKRGIYRAGAMSFLQMLLAGAHQNFADLTWESETDILKPRTHSDWLFTGDKDSLRRRLGIRPAAA